MKGRSKHGRRKRFARSFGQLALHHPWITPTETVGSVWELELSVQPPRHDSTAIAKSPTLGTHKDLWEETISDTT
jgi:hypothetical protein